MLHKTKNKELQLFNNCKASTIHYVDMLSYIVSSALINGSISNNNHCSHEQHQFVPMSNITNNSHEQYY